MLANDIFSSNESAFPTIRERFWYRFLKFLWNVSFGRWTYGHNVSDVNIIPPDELSYEAGDSLFKNDLEYKVLGRVWLIHFISKENDFYSCQKHFFTRKELDDLWYVKIIDYPMYTEKELDKMSKKQILAELNKRNMPAEE